MQLGMTNFKKARNIKHANRRKTSPEATLSIFRRHLPTETRPSSLRTTIGHLKEEEFLHKTQGKNSKRPMIPSKTVIPRITTSILQTSSLLLVPMRRRFAVIKISDMRGAVVKIKKKEKSGLKGGDEKHKLKIGAC